MSVLLEFLYFNSITNPFTKAINLFGHSWPTNTSQQIMCEFKSGYDNSQMFPMTWLLWLIDSVNCFYTAMHMN